MSERGPNWPLGCLDGLEWAKEFCRKTGFNDEGWALAWFANAIMTGYDEGRRQEGSSVPPRVWAGSWDDPRADGAAATVSVRAGGRYRLSFKTITPLDRPDLYTNAGTPAMNAHEIPVTVWAKQPLIVREAEGAEIEGLIKQYRQLAAWAASGEHYVKSPSLAMMSHDPMWVPAPEA
jgi:hypothetical protein